MNIRRTYQAVGNTQVVSNMKLDSGGSQTMQRGPHNKPRGCNGSDMDRNRLKRGKTQTGDLKQGSQAPKRTEKL